MVGPNYKRPAITQPPQFRGDATQSADASLGDTRWFDLFQDDTLRTLITDALNANWDVRIAAQRVLAAEGQVSVTRSSLFPSVNAQANSAGYGIETSVQRSHGGFYYASWEPDF